MAIAFGTDNVNRGANVNKDAHLTPYQCVFCNDAMNPAMSRLGQLSSGGQEAQPNVHTSIPSVLAAYTGLWLHSFCKQYKQRVTMWLLDQVKL